MAFFQPVPDPCGSAVLCSGQKEYAWYTIAGKAGEFWSVCPFVCLLFLLFCVLFVCLWCFCFVLFLFSYTGFAILGIVKIHLGLNRYDLY